ncbi:MAG: hypothetical protein EA383_05990 [Spirochaetaceae bacterium]|nr:MAG: hypothetical protein EA383_05990 [Spirochaetaceae bacterium]
MVRVRCLCIPVLTLAVISCATAPPRAERPADLSVITFNIWYDYENEWVARKQILHRYLTDHDADIIGLQEVISAIPEYFLLENRPLEWLERHFSAEYEIAGTESFSPLLVRRDGFEIQDSGVFWLSETPEIPWSNHWGHVVPTSVTWARVRHEGLDAEFMVMNTHLGVLNPSGRRRSIELIYSRTPSDIPVIIMGDFNETPRRYVSRYLRRRGFVDSHARSGGSFRVFAGSSFAPYRIDYIMVRGFELVESWIDTPREGGVFVSDHNALVAHLAYGYQAPLGPAPEGWPYE